jgi:DNA invertase Pin-like site-specific DNA recombinase
MGSLEKIVQAETAKRQALATLHLDLGYPSAEALAHAILDAAKGNTRVGRSAKQLPASPPLPRRGRKLTPDERKGIAKALKDGNSGSQVARDFGVSYPTVHEIKKSLGLVRERPRATTRKRRTRKA